MLIAVETEKIHMGYTSILSKFTPPTQVHLKPPSKEFARTLFHLPHDYPRSFLSGAKKVTKTTRRKVKKAYTLPNIKDTVMDDAINKLDIIMHDQAIKVSVSIDCQSSRNWIASHNHSSTAQGFSGPTSLQKHAPACPN